MAPLGTEYSMPIYEMMARLGINPGGGVLPRLSMRYATALQRCENCQSKSACRDWLDYAPAMVNFAPEFWQMPISCSTCNATSPGRAG